MKIKLGDYISWGSWAIALVLEIFPKGIVLVRGTHSSFESSSDFLLDINNPLETFKVVVLERGWRFIDPTEETRKGDLVWTGSYWLDMPEKYQHDKSGLPIRRKL